jgi:hypothetical protein
LRYFSQLPTSEDSPEALNVIVDNQITEEQIEEDIELFGARHAPMDPEEGLPAAFNTLQNGQDQVMEDIDHDFGLRPPPSAHPASFPARVNDNPSKDHIRLFKRPKHVRNGKPPNLFLPDVKEELSSSETRVLQENLLDSSLSTLNRGLSPLLSWLDQTAPPKDPNTIHRRRQERMDLQAEAKIQEIVDIERLRNVLIIPASHGDQEVLHVQNDGNKEGEMPFGARIYYRNIADRFPKAPKYLARRLAEANWARANRLGFAKFPIFNENSSDHSDSRLMDVDSSASSLSFHRALRPGAFARSEQPMKGINHISVQNGGPEINNKACSACNKTFKRMKQLKRHQKRVHSPTRKLKCPDCASTFDKENHRDHHWHFEHSAVIYRCPECLEKLPSSDLLRSHVQLEHPNSIYALFGFKAEEFKTGTTKNSDHAASIRSILPDADTIWASNNILEKKQHVDSIMTIHDARDEISPGPPGPLYIDDAYWLNPGWIGGKSSLMSRYLKRSTSRDSVQEPLKKSKTSWNHTKSSPRKLQSGSNSPTEDHSCRSPNFKRAGSMSSLDFWSGSQHHSRAGSVISSKNSSLHGYDVFDPEEQNLSSLISPPQSARGSGVGGGVSSFKLPPPPVQLGRKSSFECDICGKKVYIKRKRNWRYKKPSVIPNTHANLKSGNTFLKTWNHISVPLKLAQTLSRPFREDVISSNMK